MWRVWVLLAGCSFTPGVADGVADDANGDAACIPAARWPIDTGGAPPGYTLTIDISEPLAVVAPDQLHVLAGAVEHDRIIIGSMLETRVPATGELVLVAGEPGTAPASPASVYLFAEAFDGLPLGDDGSTRFDALPAADWHVEDDAGNHVFHAEGAARHPAAFKGMTLADGDIRARIRLGPGGTQQHNGLAARGNSMLEATMDGFVGQLMGDSNRTRIAEYTNGATPPLELSGLDRPVARDTWYALRLRFVGDVVELFIDGTLTLTATQPGSDGQLVGIYAHDTDVAYDDITVRMAIEPEPLAALGARTCP